METNVKIPAPDVQTIAPSVRNTHPDTSKTGTRTKTAKKPLTAKKALEFFLDGSLNSKVCRYCLNVTSQLLDLDAVFHIGDQKALYEITIKDMIANFYPFQVRLFTLL